MDKKIKVYAITTISKTMDCFVVESMRNLHNHGFEIGLICNMDDEFIKNNQDFAKCYPIKMDRGIDLVGAFRAIVNMYIIFKKEKCDAIQFTTPNASLYAAIAGKLAGVKHRIYNQCGLRYVSFKGKKRKIFKMLETLTCSMATSVRAQSPKNMQFAIEEKLCPSEKISVIGIGGTIGADLMEYDVSKKQEYRTKIRTDWEIGDEFLFGYVGRINVDKGINELLSAFSGLSPKYPKVKLMLVGMIDEENQIAKELLDWAKESDRVILTGNVSGKDVCKYMAAFDVLVHPTYREGFGKVLQEAMAMAVPIITTDVPGPSEVVEENISGKLVEVKNVQALYCEMESLMLDKERMLMYSVNGRKRAEKYFDRNVMLNNIWLDYVEELNLWGEK